MGRLPNDVVLASPCHHMTHWPLANIEIEGRGESFILAALAGLLGHTGFLPSTVSFNGVVVKASRSDAVYHNCGVGRAEEVSGGTRARRGGWGGGWEVVGEGGCWPGIFTNPIAICILFTNLFTNLITNIFTNSILKEKRERAFKRKETK